MDVSQPNILQHLLDELYALRRSDAIPGLERARELAARLGNPQEKFPCIHIAGTNGKGTVSSVVASVLMEAGLKVGLYTSPHILRFNERIRINGVEISNDALLERVQEIMPLVRQQNAIFFEAATVMAFQHFATEKVDIAVIETGLGGRLDATNILAPKNVLITAITSIDYDHTEFLGETLPEIAGEKAGIMKQNVPCIIAESRPELLLTFMEHSAENQAPICLLDDAYRVEIAEFHPDFSMTATLRAPKLTLENAHIPLCGSHQARNVLTAFAIIHQVRKRLPQGKNRREELVAEEVIERGLRNITQNSGLRGRIELLRAASDATPPIVLDVAHNPAGVQMLVETLRACGYADTRWHLIFGAMQDKHIDQMLMALKPITEKLIAPQLDFPRARTNTSVVELAKKHGFQANIAESVEAACRMALTERVPMLLAGSFHLAEEVLMLSEMFGQYP
ncbi:MAG: bifunctional folylpolyglutamate synthase/dihydrofolate synthase [Candidatus Kapaibacterium sp.]|nr:MAG: bifunctional folylpolyglutamate synthase/dihydrofolate synthase [Candidatus Kapabacteria bacterium]